MWLYFLIFLRNQQQQKAEWCRSKALIEFWPHLPNQTHQCQGPLLDTTTISGRYHTRDWFKYQGVNPALRGSTKVGRERGKSEKSCGEQETEYRGDGWRELVGPMSRILLVRCGVFGGCWAATFAVSSSIGLLSSQEGLSLLLATYLCVSVPSFVHTLLFPLHVPALLSAPVLSSRYCWTCFKNLDYILSDPFVYFNPQSFIVPLEFPLSVGTFVDIIFVPDDSPQLGLFFFYFFFIYIYLEWPRNPVTIYLCFIFYVFIFFVFMIPVQFVMGRMEVVANDIWQ